LRLQARRRRGVPRTGYYDAIEIMSTGLRQLIHDTLKSGVLAPEKGKPKTTLQALGWTDALESYQPFLSYNELGSMLDEGPER